MIPLHYRLALTCTVTYPKRQIHFLSCFVTELNEIWSDDGPGEDLCTHNTRIFFRFNVGTNFQAQQHFKEHMYWKMQHHKIAQ